MKRLLFLGVAGLFLAACATASPVRQFTKGDEIAYYDFTQPGTFEEGTYNDGEARLQIKDGVYIMMLTEGDSELWYGQWGDSLDDVVVDVEARQFTESQNTIYGVMCRVRGTVGQQAAIDPTLEAMAAEKFESSPLIAQAEATLEALASGEMTPEADATAEATEAADEEATAEATEAAAEATEEAAEPTAESTSESTEEGGAATLLNPNNGDGYLFLVGSNGRFAIMRSRGRSVTPLVNWTSHSAIQTGPAVNRIRAVCLGDYLAMYVNGTFVGDATDDTYTQGQVGLVGASADRLGLLVQFDNLSVSTASAS
jgi:hypothetical protein